MMRDANFKPYQFGRFVHPHPETVWVSPCDSVMELAHTIRYGTREQVAEAVMRDRYIVASVMDGYHSLVTRPSAARQLPGMRAAMRNVVTEVPEYVGRKRDRKPDAVAVECKKL